MNINEIKEEEIVNYVSRVKKIEKESLMLGNWYYGVRYDDLYGEPYESSFPIEFDIDLKDTIKKRWNFVTLHQIELTEEILIAFDFYERREGDGCLSTHINPAVVLSLEAREHRGWTAYVAKEIDLITSNPDRRVYLKEIYYLDELQNLYRILSGSELLTLVEPFISNV